MTKLANKKEFFLRWLPLAVMLTLVVVCLSGCQIMDGLFSDEHMTEYDNEYTKRSGCWGCLIFEALFNAINGMINALYPMVVEGCRKLLAVLFALWILYKVGNVFFSFKQPDMGEFWSEFARMCIAVIFCAAILTNKDTLFTLVDYTLVPAFEGMVNMGVAIIERTFENMGMEVNPVQDNIINAGNSNYAGCAMSHVVSDEKGVAFDNGMKETMTCVIFEMHKRLSYAYFFAYKLIVYGEILSIIVGVGMLVIFLLIGLVFPFYLVDGIFRVGIVFIILPILVVFWPFKPLRQFATAAWRLVLSAFVQVTMMAVFVTLMVEIVTDFTLVSVGRIDGVPEFVEQSNRTAGIDFIKQNIDSTPEKLFFMLFISFYAYKFMGKVAHLSAQLVGANPQTTLFAKATGILARMLASLTLMAARGAKVASNMAKSKKGRSGGGKSEGGEE